MKYVIGKEFDGAVLLGGFESGIFFKLTIHKKIGNIAKKEKHSDKKV